MAELMSKFLDKLFAKSRNPGTGNGVLDDYMQLERIFNLSGSSVETNEDIQQFLDSLFLNINRNTNIKLQVFFTQNSTRANWFEIISRKRQPPVIHEFINNHFNSIFATEIMVHTENQFETQKIKKDDWPFLTLRLGQIYFYIIKILKPKNCDLYYYFLQAQLAQLLKTHKGVKDRKQIEGNLQHLKNELFEKEQTLRSADKAIKRKVYDLHNLVEASNEIYSILNFRQLINSALLTIIGQIGFQSAFIMMYDSFSHKYNQGFQKGLKESDLSVLQFDIEEPIVRHFTKHRTPTYVEKLEKNKELESYARKLNALGIYLIAPIIYSERLQGVIGASEKLYGSNFLQSDFEIFHVLVNIISISIGNARLYEEVKNLSLTDGMTNLHNYRYFESRLKEEINRARRNKNKVSLLLLDIDHFKNYNDTLGHQAGDEALRNVGAVLKKTVRDEDIVTRYGGEEFCIILPGISKSGIKPLGERVRKQIETFEFYKEEVQPAGKVTVSLGGATFPDDAADFDKLVRSADEALYQAKSMGRNQLRIYKKPN